MEAKLMFTSQRTLPLFYDLQAVIQSSSALRKYQAIFKALDLSEFPDRPCDRGRQGVSRHAILRAMIVKHLERIDSMPQLARQINANPVLADLCGFDTELPEDDPTVFYRFLKHTPNSQIQNLMHRTVKTLIDSGELSDDVLIVDSKPILAATRQNNPKNPRRKLTSSLDRPKRNPQATLGYYSYQKLETGDGQNKRMQFFWGYRTHVIVNAQGVPLVEATTANTVSDAKAAQTLLKKLKGVYGSIRDQVVIGDKAYDVKKLYELIVTQMKARAIIPVNPRNQKHTADDFDRQGTPVCPAGMTMCYQGRCDEVHRKRLKYRCPIKVDTEVAERCGHRCPIDGPRFDDYGCTRYVDVTHDARAQIDRQGETFKRLYALRQTVEQYFARFGPRPVEQTTHYSRRSVKNQVTIGHLSLALVAAAAVAMERTDKLRSYRTLCA
jgi:hypothetical protein